MIEGFVHAWHNLVFWWAVGATVIVIYDHPGILKSAYDKVRPFFPGGQPPQS